MFLDQGGGPTRVAAGRECVGGVGDELGQIEVRVGRAAWVGQHLEGLLVVLGSLVRAAHGHRLVAGPDAGVDGGVVVHREPGVPGQFGRRPKAVALAQRIGEAGMQSDAFARQQVVVRRLAEQRVSEGVAGALRHQHVHLDRLAQRLLQHARLDS